jgi:hypothetical protein
MSSSEEDCDDAGDVDARRIAAVSARLALFAAAGATARWAVLRVAPRAPRGVALLLGGAVAAALTAHWVWRVRGDDSAAYWQLVPPHWEESAELVRLVFARFRRDVVARQRRRHPFLLNLLLADLVQERLNAAEPSGAPLPPAALPEQLALFTAFALASYGFFLPNALQTAELPRPLPELVAAKTGVAESDVLFFNHSLAASLSSEHRAASRSVDKEHVTLPRYFIALHRPTKSLVLAIRGSVAVRDIVTDLLCDSVPFLHGAAHRGILGAAKTVLADAAPRLAEQLQLHPDFRLVVTGHSLGGGCATLIALLLLSGMPSLPLQLSAEQRASLRCFAIAPPPVVGPASAFTAALLGFDPAQQIVALVNGDDVVPRLSFHSVSRLIGAVDAIDALPMGLAERISALRRSDAAAVEAQLSPALRNLFLFNAVASDDAADPELTLCGAILWKRDDQYWRDDAAGRLQHILLSRNMLIDHFPSSYATPIDKM